LHGLGLQGGSTEPVPHVLACCQGHHHHGDISHDPDVMEVVFMMSSSNPDVSVRVGGAKGHCHHGDVTSNPAVTSSTIAKNTRQGGSTLDLSQTN